MGSFEVQNPVPWKLLNSMHLPQVGQVVVGVVVTVAHPLGEVGDHGAHFAGAHRPREVIVAPGDLPLHLLGFADGGPGTYFSGKAIPGEKNALLGKGGAELGAVPAVDVHELEVGEEEKAGKEEDCFHYKICLLDD